MDKILLFIPMYNCEKQIVRVLDQLDDEVCQYLSEVIVVNNRSTDNGERAVKEYLDKNKKSVKISLFRNDQNYGLGGSHKVAFQYAVKNNFDYIIVLHGDDQGRIKDLLPILKTAEHKKHDCCLGSRFMKDSKPIGYSKIRIWGNYGFNLIFSAVVHKKITDLGSGLNIYKVSMLESEYFLKYPDTLYFNALMILASCYFKHDMYFFPITWREEDQVSNNKLWICSKSLLGMLWNYCKNKDKYIKADMRTKKIDGYTVQVIYTNRPD